MDALSYQCHVGMSTIYSYITSQPPSYHSEQEKTWTLSFYIRNETFERLFDLGVSARYLRLLQEAKAHPSSNGNPASFSSVRIGFVLKVRSNLKKSYLQNLTFHEISLHYSVIFNSYACGTSVSGRWTFKSISGNLLIDQSLRPKIFIPAKNTFTTFVLYRFPSKFGLTKKKIISHLPFCEFCPKIEFNQL